MINIEVRKQTSTLFDPLIINKTCPKDKQDVFVKQECPRNGHSLRDVTFIFDLDLCR